MNYTPAPILKSACGRTHRRDIDQTDEEAEQRDDRGGLQLRHAGKLLPEDGDDGARERGGRADPQREQHEEEQDGKHLPQQTAGPGSVAGLGWGVSVVNSAKTQWNSKYC